MHVWTPQADFIDDGGKSIYNMAHSDEEVLGHGLMYILPDNFSNVVSTF